MPATEVGALIEDLRSQFRIFGEKLKALEDKFDCRLDTLETKVDGIATNQARTLERATSLEITARKIQTDITEIKSRLETHDKRITRLEEISAK